MISEPPSVPASGLYAAWVRSIVSLAPDGELGADGDDPVGPIGGATGDVPGGGLAAPRQAARTIAAASGRLDRSLNTGAPPTNRLAGKAGRPAAMDTDGSAPWPRADAEGRGHGAGWRADRIDGPEHDV